MNEIFLSRSALRSKANSCLDRYLSLSDKQHISVGLYMKGKKYILKLNDNENELFYDIGSVSKTITAHLILKLFDEEQIDIQTPVSSFFNLKHGKYPTVYELLTHTAGYRHLTPVEITLPMLIKHRYSHYNPYETVKEYNVLKALEKRRKAKNSSRYNYSDFSYAILALVAERVKNKPFAQQITEFITNDLEMKNTYITKENRYPFAVFNGKIIPYWKWYIDNPYIAAGGLVSNVYDMLSYLSLQIEGDKSYITQAHKVCQNSFVKNKNIGTCTGWHTYKKSNQLWHVGGVGTFRSSVIFNKKRKIGVVVLGNTKGVSSANVHYIAKMLYSEIKINKVKF